MNPYLLEGARRIKTSGMVCADPILHMRQIVALATGWTLAQVLMKDALEEKTIQQCEEILKRRLDGEPFQYISGEEGFWKSNFKVGPGVLIPRRETELLVETLLKIEIREEVRIAELGAGTGNIGISCLLEKPQWKWTALEMNPRSLPYSKDNRSALLPKSSYEVLEGDFFAWMKTQENFDWLVSNPPYVSSEEMAALQKEVTREPPLALFGGEKGLDILFNLIDVASTHLNQGAGCLFEFGVGQGSVLLDYAKKKIVGGEISLLKDYSGKERALLVKV